MCHRDIHKDRGWRDSARRGAEWLFGASVGWLTPLRPLPNRYSIPLLGGVGGGVRPVPWRPLLAHAGGRDHSEQSGVWDGGGKCFLRPEERTFPVAGLSKNLLFPMVSASFFLPVQVSVPSSSRRHINQPPTHEYFVRWKSFDENPLLESSLITATSIQLLSDLLRTCAPTHLPIDPLALPPLSFTSTCFTKHATIHSESSFFLSFIPPLPQVALP